MGFLTDDVTHWIPIGKLMQKRIGEKGYAFTSVRDITNEAGCNVAAVNYHFGGKENLYIETFRGLLGELRDRRIRRIQGDMEAAGKSATLELFIESMANAFLEPLVKEGRGRLLMAIVSREMIDRRLPTSVFFGEFIQPLVEGAMEQLVRVVPPMEPVTGRLCLMSLVGQLLHVVKARHMMRHMLRDEYRLEVAPEDIEEHIRHVVRFSAGGFRACAMDDEQTEGCSTSRETAS